MSPYARNRTSRKHHSDLPAKEAPAPPGKLAICNMPVPLVLWTVIMMLVLCTILVPCCLQNPPIQTNSMETINLRYTLGLLIFFWKSSSNLLKISGNLYNLIAAETFTDSWHELTAAASAPVK